MVVRNQERSMRHPLLKRVRVRYLIGCAGIVFGLAYSLLNWRSVESSREYRAAIQFLEANSKITEEKDVTLISFRQSDFPKGTAQSAFTFQLKDRSVVRIEVSEIAGQLHVTAVQ